MKDFLNNKLNIFLMISLLGIIIYGAWLISAEDTKPAEWLVMEHNYNWQFSDFYRQIVYSSDLNNIYYNTNDAPFPPLAYLFYNILYKMNPKAYNVSINSWQECMNYQFNGLIFLMIELVNVVLLYVILRKNLKKLSEKKFLLFMLAILFSAPFLAGAIERGNAILMVLTLILFALYIKDSNNKIYRHLSLISLAIATGFKIYPAIFIILWLKDKKIKDAFKEIILFGIYCIIFVLLPFAFTGGIDGLNRYCQNLAGLVNYLGIRWTSIELYSYSICKTVGITYIPEIAIITKWLFLIFGCVYAYFTKEKWKSCLPLATLMGVFVLSNYRYVSIYLLIPLVYFLANDNKMRFSDYIYAVLFAFVFTIPMWAINLEVDFAIFTPIYLLNIVLILEIIIKGIVYIKKQHKEIKTYQ